MAVFELELSHCAVELCGFDQRWGLVGPSPLSRGSGPARAVRPSAVCSPGAADSALPKNAASSQSMRKRPRKDVVPEVKKMAQPLVKIKAGNGVSAAIWENEALVNGKTVTMLKATVERRYKDNNSNWKSSGSFGRNEIPHAIFCLRRAFEWMIEERSVNDDEQAQSAR